MITLAMASQVLATGNLAFRSFFILAGNEGKPILILSVTQRSKFLRTSSSLIQDREREKEDPGIDIRMSGTITS